jgi:shikimate kinase
MRRPVVLVGFMGAGKSAVGPRLAACLGWPFVDLDDRIEAAAGRTIAELFVHPGEAAFRRLETAALGRALDECAGGGVIAGGGGLWAEPENRERCAARGACVVWLDAPLDDVVRRVGAAVDRPLFRDPAAAATLYRERRAAYATARLRIDASGADVAAVVERTLAALADCATMGGEEPTP